MTRYPCTVDSSRQSLTFVLFLFQIREIGLAGSRIGGHNRGESVDGAGLKPLSPVKNYGAIMEFFLRFVLVFFRETERWR